MRHLLTFTLPFLVWPALCACWGSLGHRTVAYLASQYLSLAELDLLAELTNASDISDAAVWADEISKDPGYAYSSSWHYLNVRDNPPSTCGIVFPRDYKTGSSDILTAFVNHTAIAADSHSSSGVATPEALRFIIHWIGDVHQPLHLEDLARGGNDIAVVFDREPTNLHAVWDIEIPQKLRNPGAEKEAALQWALELFERDCQSVDGDQHECEGLMHAEQCIVQWAKEANNLVCDAALAPGLAKIKELDLGGEYYAQNAPVVERQIARAGRRLGGWLKLILRESGQVRGFWPESEQILR